MIGSPKKHIENTIKLYIDKLEENHKGVKLISKDIAKAKKTKDAKLYNIFADIEISVEKVEDLTWFCIDYMPSSIEIVEPDKVEFDAFEFNSYINDLLSKLHKIGEELKKLKIVNETVIHNAMTLMKNIILIQLKEKPKTSIEIANTAGVPNEHAIKFLEALIKEGKIIKKDEKYYLN
jgi:predicted transcriptional regulator